MSQKKQIALASTVRAGYEEMVFFISYYQSIGVDLIILFLDDPNDKNAGRLQEKFDDLILVVCDDAYWRSAVPGKPKSIEERQTININRALAISRERNTEWLINVDLDELVFSHLDIKKALAKYDEPEIDAVRFDVYEAVAEKLYYRHIFEPSLFRKNPSPKRLKIASLLGCRGVLFQNEYFRGHLASKLAIKVNSQIKEIKIHNIVMEEGEPNIKKVNDIKLLHFDCIGIDNWRQKWERRIDGSGRAAEMRGNRQAQMEYYIEAKEAGSDTLQKAYLNMYGIPKYQQLVLMILGLLERIRIKGN